MDPYLIKPMRNVRRVGVVKPYTRASKGGEIPLTPRAPRQQETAPEEVLFWMRSVSRERAMKAWKKKKSLGQLATLPELLAYMWLEARPHQFSFQSSLMGGRLVTGGAVADFIISDLRSDGLSVWRIQGDYWHTRPATVEKDAQQKERLLREFYLGQPIVEVVDIWESRTYWGAPDVFERAELGEEMGRMAARTEQES